jgi:hypothetical protein
VSSYISSNSNRFYVALEPSYGEVAAITAGNRIPAVRLQAHQQLQSVRRMDKSGSRTFLGTPATSRRVTAFALHTYLTSWSGSGQPCYGPLFQAVFGAAPLLSHGLTVAALEGSNQLQTTTPHGLTPGAAVSCSAEIRFITAVPDAQTFVLNAPFSTVPAAGAPLASTVTYRLATDLPSVSIYDYWDPITAVSRVVIGAAADALDISINGDVHEFTFSGPAADLLDSSSFATTATGLASYPQEPALMPFDYSIVPGHLGEVWLGGTASQFFSLTGATISVRNHLDVRNHEFGSSYPRAVTPGPRQVLSRFTLLAQDDAQTVALYAAAKQRTPIGAMLQLGRQQGQLLGVYMPGVVPEVPVYDDSRPRLQWEFNNNLAKGTSDDEFFLAFA